MTRRAPRITHSLAAPVLPHTVHTDTLDGDPTHPTGAPTWMWEPAGEVPPNVTPAPFADVWAGNADTDRAWRS